MRLTPAKSTARLARVCKSAHERLSDPEVARWCAASRKSLLKRRGKTGDLPLGDAVDWTLERLHLCEHPPRFPSIFFKFAADAIEDGGGQSSEIAKVAALLKKHPKLRIRIHGYAQPDAPPIIGEALAQARATAVRHALLLKLAGVPEFASEDPFEGVRPDTAASPWSSAGAWVLTSLVGDKIQALGRWGHSPQNNNFAAAGGGGEAAAEEEEDDDDDLYDLEEEVAEAEGPAEIAAATSGGDSSEDDEDDEEDDEDDEDSSDDGSDFGGQRRRAEFTLLKLDV